MKSLIEKAVHPSLGARLLGILLPRAMIKPHVVIISCYFPARMLFPSF